MVLIVSQTLAALGFRMFALSYLAINETFSVREGRGICWLIWGERTRSGEKSVSSQNAKLECRITAPKIHLNVSS